MIKKIWMVLAVTLSVAIPINAKDDPVAAMSKADMFEVDPVATANASLSMKIGQVFSHGSGYVNNQPVGIKTIFLGVNRYGYFILKKEYSGRDNILGKKLTDPYLSEPLTLSGDPDARIRGLYTQYFPDGKKSFECYYETKRSSPDYPCVSWYNDGTKALETQHILVEAWVDSAGIQPSTYRWVEEGDYQSWYPNGEKECIGKHKTGRPIGTFTCWYNNGQKRSEGYYTDENQPVKVTYWHKNGQKRAEETRLRGAKIDTWRKWSVNGTLLEEANYKNGTLDGLFIQWYENGQKRKEGNYKYNPCIGNERVGVWREWNKDGKLLYKKRFFTSRCPSKIEALIFVLFFK